MDDTGFSPRQERERNYYDTYTERVTAEQVDFEPVRGQIKRPWNSYWHVCALAVEHFRSRDQRLLDFGCGSGYCSIQYAAIGYEVFGFDISSKAITQAQHLARSYGYEDRTTFATGTAEALGYPDAYFDAVIGIDILHHVEIQRALAECWRVLKPGGIAIFHEPVRAPIFDSLRESRLGTWLVPNTASFEAHITEDEKKLDSRDLGVVSGFDQGLGADHFLLFSRLGRLARGTKTTLERFDHQVLRAFPFLKRFAGRVVLTLHR